MPKDPITLSEEQKDALSMTPHLLEVIETIINSINKA